MLLSILLASFLVMLVSLSGKLATWRGVGPLIERNLHFFVSFAAGVLLMIAYSLTREIIEHAGSLSAGLPWIAIGAVFILVAFRYIPSYHHHHDASSDGHTHSRIDANRILVSDAIHNVGDGAVIVVSFAASPLVGIASTVSIMIHEMLQEISEFFVLRQAGLSVGRALLFNFISSSTVLIGALGAYFALTRFEVLEIPLMGLAVGSYIIVVFHDLIPHSLSRGGPRHLWRHVMYFAIGLALMGTLGYVLPHAEPEGLHPAQAALPELS